MNLSSFYPVVLTEAVTEASAFWVDHFGFEETFTSDWYVSLRRPDGQELAFLTPSHETIPEGHRQATGTVLLNLEVDDVDAEWARLVESGTLQPLQPIRSEAFGQRHFIVSAPGGVLVDVITEIEPEAEFADAFVG